MRFSGMVLICLTVCCALLNACSTGGDNLNEIPATLPAIENESATPGFSFGAAGLADLPEPTHAISLAGPGWHELPLSSALATVGVITPHPADELPLVATSGPSYALFGVSDFDGDCGPTSARISLHDMTGEYYVAFSDYQNNEWLYNGPFTGAATVEIPNDGEYSYASSFVSDLLWSYFLVVVPAGSSANLSKVELGIDGGSTAPRAPFGGGAYGADTQVKISWFPSNDCGRPDFAGYLLERAPLFSGDYILLTPDPLVENYFFDDTAVESMQYRYRLSAVDTSGNAGIGTSFTGGLAPGYLLNPVPVVDFPDGPLYGPLEIDFDMSGSFDPEGQPIDTYSIALNGNFSAVSGANPVKTINIPPGCYTYTITAVCGTRASSRFGSFKVYPQWEETPVTIAEVPANSQRGLWFSTGVHPTTGELVHGYIDAATGQFRVVALDAGGHATYHSVETTPGAFVLHNPTEYQDQLLFCVQSPTAIQIIAFDGTEARTAYQTQPYEQNLAGLATDGERVWLIICWFDGAIYNLTNNLAGSISGSYSIIEDCGDIAWIGAEYNPAVDAIDIVFTRLGSNQLFYVRDNLDSTPGTAVEISIGATANTAEMVINPANGRPMVLYNEITTNRHMFSALTNDLVTWTAPEAVDDTMNNLAIGRLVLNDGYPTALIGLVDGTVGVHRRSSSWTKTNTLTNGLTSLAICSLVKEPGHSGVTASYKALNEGLQTYHANLDGTNDLLWTESLVGPLGQNLEGAAGLDGLHVIFKDPGGNVFHYRSMDGTVWSNLGNIAATSNVDLTTTCEGELYLSRFTGSSAYLDWWDGGGWNNEMMVTTDTDHRPFLDAPLGSFQVFWGVYDTLTPQMVYARVQHGFVATINNVSGTGNIWAGQVFGPNRTFLMRTGTDPTSSVGCIGVWGSSSSIPILYSTASRLFTDNPYNTRIMASGSYITRRPYVQQGACWVASSSTGLPVRLNYYDNSLQETTTLDLGAGPDAVEFYSVAGLETPSYTAVGLIANLTGEYTRLEWSNFGDWEELPLPGGLEHMMSPELVCGLDGRWHIIYRDWVTDHVMCLSTL